MVLLSCATIILTTAILGVAQAQTCPSNDNGQCEYVVLTWPPIVFPNSSFKSWDSALLYGWQVIVIVYLVLVYIGRYIPLTDYVVLYLFS